MSERFNRWFVTRTDNRRANVIADLYCYGHTPMATWLISAGMPKYAKKHEVFKWLSENFNINGGEVFFGACVIVAQSIQAKAAQAVKEIGSWADYRTQ